MNSDEAKARAEEAFQKIKEIAEAAWERGVEISKDLAAKAKEMAAKSKSKAGDIADEANDAADDATDTAGEAVDKAQELAAKADDKTIDLSEKDDGVVGAAAGAAHKVIDQVDGD